MNNLPFLLDSRCSLFLFFNKRKTPESHSWILVPESFWFSPSDKLPLLPSSSRTPMKLLSHWLMSQCCRSVLGFSFTHPLAVLVYIFPLCHFSVAILLWYPFAFFHSRLFLWPSPKSIFNCNLRAWSVDIFLCIFLIWLLIRSTVFLWTPSFALQYCQRPWQKPFLLSINW